MTQSTKRSVGNLSYVFKAHVVCDAPWAWTFPKTYTFTYGNNVVVADYTFLNDSANSDYIYPQLNFTLNSAGTYFTLVNKTDSNRTFQFTGLNNGETIQVDNDRQIIVSSVPYAHRLSNFIGYKWFRLLPGVNLLSINAAIGTFSITYNLARKIGG
jgi:phage-related protein